HSQGVREIGHHYWPFHGS
ncbi:hypothetical protein HKBW3S43_01360, partial [Candidatus Hakubella thermalkaliphila]